MSTQIATPTYASPDVIRPPVYAGDIPGLPGFPTIAYEVDRFARRIPWWVWLAAGAIIIYRYGPRRGSAAL